MFLRMCLTDSASTKFPSHYFLLLITQKMTSSPFFKPALDVSRVILTGLQLQIKVGRKERAAQFGNQLFGGVAFIAPALAPEIAVKP